MQRQTVSYSKPFIEYVYSKLSTLEQEADESIQSQIKDLQAKLEKEIDILDNKIDRLFHDLIEDKEFDISNKRQRLEKLKQNPNKMRKQIVYGMFSKRKRKIKSQVEKKTGKYFIDRISEKAIYNKLAENAKAHRRRHGVEGTNCMDEESQRIQSREMRRIANIALKKLNGRLIKLRDSEIIIYLSFLNCD